MSHQRYDLPGNAPADYQHGGAVHGLFYAVPISLILWTFLISWLFIGR